MNRNVAFLILWFITAPATGQRLVSEPKASGDAEHSGVVSFQEKRTWSFSSKKLKVDNLFSGARMSGASLHGNTLRIRIAPESSPINGSSWYAFRVTSRTKQRVTIELNYEHAPHRYHPKWSTDGRTWRRIDKKKIHQASDGSKAWFQVTLPAGVIYFSAQEIVTSQQVLQWCRTIDRYRIVRATMIGKSKLSRDLPALDIYEGKKEGKQIIVVLGRQHPPEVTGYFAMRHFIERLVTHEKATAFFKKYRVIVLPMINPDGIDLGHWRLNAGGVDLNRDYDDISQPEIKAVTEHITQQANTSKSELILGIDFHSTYEDVYYTNSENAQAKRPEIKTEWLALIQEKLLRYGYRLREEQHSIFSNPSAQHWFQHAFGATGVTYEIGDETPRDFIKVKAVASANALVQVLLK